MYALRRCASRVLTSRPTSFISPSRTYTSFTAPTSRIASRSPAFQLQRRWATTESEEKPLEATEETLAAETESTPNDAQTLVADTANATEATEAQAGETVADDASHPVEDNQGTPRFNNLFEKKNTLYIGNLFFDVTETDLVKEFARFGQVNRAKIVRDNRGLSKGFGYVDFATQEAADAAMDRLNMSLFEGRRITVQYAARNTGTQDEGKGPHRVVNPPSKTLFVGNMSFEMTDRDLTNLFRGVRNVIDVRVAIDRRTGQPRGFAHADFIDVKSAMEAMKILTDKEVYGRKLRVDFSFSSSSNRAPRNNPPEEQDN